jgi:hypothetical protein
MPPSGYPHVLNSPSPRSPTEWCISTYAVPGSSGPAHVPMMPSVESAAITSSDSNHSERRSAADIVKSFVRFATVRRSSPLRNRSANLSCSTRSPGAVEPTGGGVSISAGPRKSAFRWIHSPHSAIRSASRFENRAIRSCSSASSSSGSRSAPDPGCGAYVAPIGNTRYP